MIGVAARPLIAERRIDERTRRVGPQPTLLPLMGRAPGVPACAGLSEMFDSTEPDVIEQARRVCNGCGVRSWCTAETRHAVDARLPIAGTWAGVAYAAGTAVGTGVVDA